MTNEEFIKEIAGRTRLSEYAIKDVFNAAADIIPEKIIAGETVDIPRIGIFKTATRSKMIGKNLIGGVDKELEECTYPIFQICKPMKSKIKNALKYRKSS